MFWNSETQARQHFPIYSITKLSYATINKIVLLSFTLFSCFSCSVQKVLYTSNDGKVYTDGKIIGTINGTAVSNYVQCYSIYTDTVFQQKIDFIVPVAVIGMNNNKVYAMDYTLTREEHDGNIDFIISSIGTSENYQCRFTRHAGKKNVSILKTASASYHYQIATDDFVDLPSTLICSKAYTLTKRKKAYSFDLRKGLFKENDGKSCFHCPATLSVERCLELKAAQKDFNWNTDRLQY